MSLIDRILEVAKSELHAALDHVEDPEAMFEQALRDAETEIEQARARVRDVLVNRLRIEDELAREKTLVENWEGRAEQAVAAGDEALAKQALAVAAEHRRQAFLIEESLVNARESVAAMEAALSRREGRLQLMQEQREHILNQMRRAQIEDMADGVGEDSPLDLFDRMKAKVDEAYYQGKAAEQMSGVSEEQLAQKFEKMEAHSGPSQGVKDKLAELKARLNSQS